MAVDFNQQIAENLAELERRHTVVGAERTLMASMLSEHILEHRKNESLDTLYRHYCSLLTYVSTVDKLTFSKACADKLTENELSSLLPFTQAGGFTAAGAHGKIAYIRNKFNDEALDVFSSVIRHAKAVQFTSFEDSCEAVASDECEYALLPLESTADGKMFGFYHLLDRYELKIAYAYLLESDDSSQSVLYAMVGKHFKLSAFDTLGADEERIFEFSLIYDSTPKQLDILSAASLLGAKEHKTSCITLPYDRDMTRFYHSFIITKDTDFLPFLIYLSLEFSQYSPIGIYKEI